MEMMPLKRTIDQWTKFFNKNLKWSHNDNALLIILDTIADATGSQNFQMSIQNDQ